MVSINDTEMKTVITFLCQSFIPYEQDWFSTWHMLFVPLSQYVVSEILKKE